MPFAPGPFFILLALLAGLLLALQLQLVGIAFERLGLTPDGAMLLLFASLLGSLINLPLFKLRATAPPPQALEPLRRLGLLRHRPPPFRGYTLIALNVGGGLVPVPFSLHLLTRLPLAPLNTLLAIAIVSGIARMASQPVPGFGIAMPIFVAPLAAAITALLLAPAGLSAPLAYVCGTLGVLIGADLSRLPDIRKLGAPVASIGGAGSFDGIFITGIVAALLA